MTDSRDQSGRQPPGWQPAPAWSPQSFVDRVPEGMSGPGQDAHGQTSPGTFTPPPGYGPGQTQPPPQFATGRLPSPQGTSPFPGWGPPPPLGNMPPAPMAPPPAEAPAYESTSLPPRTHSGISGSTGTSMKPPQQPMGRPRRKSGVLSLLTVFIGGLAVGLGVGVGLHVSGALPPSGAKPSTQVSTPTPSTPPKPVDTSVDKLPATFFGLQRADLDGSPDAAQKKAAAEAYAESMAQSYGGPGVQMTYGDGKAPMVTLWVQNGALPLPLGAPDSVLIKQQLVAGWIDIPGTATAQCRVNLYPGVKLSPTAGAADVAAAKESVYASKGETHVVCIRYDAKRGVSVQANVQKLDSLPRGEIAQKLAAAVDEEFVAITK